MKKLVLIDKIYWSIWGKERKMFISYFSNSQTFAYSTETHHNRYIIEL